MVIERLLAQFAADAATLEADEGRCGIKLVEAIDPDCIGADAVGDGVGFPMLRIGTAGFFSLR